MIYGKCFKILNTFFSFCFQIKALLTGLELKKMLEGRLKENQLLLYFLVLSADNLCKHFGPTSGSKLFDTDGIPEIIF